jgi:hypothetical protein
MEQEATWSRTPSLQYHLDEEQEARLLELLFLARLVQLLSSARIFCLLDPHRSSMNLSDTPSHPSPSLVKVLLVV